MRIVLSQKTSDLEFALYPFYRKEKLIQAIKEYSVRVKAGKDLVFVAREGGRGRPLAAAVARVFEWSEIQSQLYYEPLFSPQGILVAVRLVPFSRGPVVLKLKKPEFALELAYNFVPPKSRRKGIGKALVNARLEFFRSNFSSGDLIFSSARSSISGSGSWKQIFDIVLDKERYLNGTDPLDQTRVRVKGEPMLIELIKHKLKLNSFEVSTATQALPTETIMGKIGLKYVLLSKNLSKTYLQSLKNTLTILNAE